MKIHTNANKPKFLRSLKNNLFDLLEGYNLNEYQDQYDFNIDDFDYYEYGPRQVEPEGKESIKNSAKLHIQNLQTESDAELQKESVQNITETGNSEGYGWIALKTSDGRLHEFFHEWS